MTIRNFRNLRTIEGYPHAEVDVTTGIWPFRKTQTVAVTKESYWFFVDTGRFTPNLDVEDLEKGYFVQKKIRERAHDAQMRLENEEVC